MPLVFCKQREADIIGLIAVVTGAWVRRQALA